jgi:hypothetical protein
MPVNAARGIHNNTRDLILGPYAASSLRLRALATLRSLPLPSPQPSARKPCGKETASRPPHQFPASPLAKTTLEVLPQSVMLTIT